MKIKLIILSSVLTLAACSDNISGRYINIVNDLCKTHQGVSEVRIAAPQSSENYVYCNNGTRFVGEDFYNHVVGEK
jgi:hypothetical protein